MGINRFTKYTAPQFVQSYDPYPVEKMMGLAQHQQKRFDQIDTAIGKAYSDAVIKPGLSVESRKMATTVNKERKEQLDNLVNDFYENRNVRGAVRGLSELSSNWKGDTRADFVNADRELMKGVLTQTSQEGYGDYSTHKALNSTTGEYTLGLTDDQIAAGQVPTMGDYGVMSNPGSAVAFKGYIDPVKEKIFSNLSKDAQGNIITQDGKLLDAQRFLDKAGADIDKLSSDGWNIDQPSDGDPETQKWIKWRQKEFAEKGKVYTINDFKEDFLTEAEKYTYGANKSTIKAAPGGSKSRKDAINSSNSAMFLGSPSTSNLNSKEISKELAEGGIETFAKNLGFEDEETMYSAVVNPGNKVAKDEQVKDIEQRVRSEYGSMPREYNLSTDANGKTIKIPVKTDADIEDEIENRIKNLSKGLDKAYQLTVQSYNELSFSDKAKIQVNDNGTFELTPGAQAKLDAKIAGKTAVMNMPMLDPLIGLFQGGPDAIGEKFEALSDKEKKAMAVAARRIQGNKKVVNFLEDPAQWGRWLEDELGYQVDDIAATGGAAIYEGIADIAFSGTENALRKLHQGADKVTKELYGSKTYHNNTIHLQDKDMIGITTQVNPLHQIFSGIGKTNFKSGQKMFTNGKEISLEDLGDVKDANDNSGVDFNNGEFDPDFIEFDMVGKGNFKVYATGHVNRSVGSGADKINHRTMKPVQVDITQEFMANMGQNEQSQLLYQDAILDSAYELVPNGQDKVSVYLNAGVEEEAREFFGGEDGAMISKRIGQDGLPVYSISGKVAIFDENNELQEVQAEDYRVGNESPFVGMNQQQMLATARDIASALPYLTQDTTGASITPAEEAAVQDAGIDISDVESFEVGAFGLNTQTNGSALKQVDVGFASNIQAVENPIDQMSPKDQTTYASYLFVNGDNGWNEWDVTKKNSSGGFENAKFDTAINVLKGLGNTPTPGDIVNVLKANKKQLDIDKVDAIMIQNIMAEFSPAALNRKSKNSYRKSDIASNKNISESLVAIATVVAQSGLNSNAIDINQK